MGGSLSRQSQRECQMLQINVALPNGHAELRVTFAFFHSSRFEGQRPNESLGESASDLSLPRILS